MPNKCTHKQPPPESMPNKCPHNQPPPEPVPNQGTHKQPPPEPHTNKPPPEQPTPNQPTPHAMPQCRSPTETPHDHFSFLAALSRILPAKRRSMHLYISNYASYSPGLSTKYYGMLNVWHTHSIQEGSTCSNCWQRWSADDLHC